MLLAALLALGLGSAQGPFELEDLAGEPVRVAPPGRGALLLHFWATWCVSCVEELPLLEAAAERCRDSGVRILAVNVGESAQEVRDYLASQALGLQVLRDPKGRVWRGLSGAGLPANASWREGAQRIDLGPRSAEAWRDELARLGCAQQSGPPGQASSVFVSQSTTALK